MFERRVAFADPDPPVVAAGVWSLGAQVVGDGGKSRGLHRPRAASGNHTETLSGITAKILDPRG